MVGRAVRFPGFFLIALWSGISGQAQSDSAAHTLPLVVIAAVPGARTGFSVWQADSLPQADVLALADRLLWEMPIGVRANAPGTLATVSARGAGPARTAVLWQGLNLQSPMNGVVDVSLIPLWPDDQVEIQYGGQSAAQSTGAMGGAVRISPNILEDVAGWYTQAGIGIGSFGRRDAQVSTGYAGARLRTLVRAGGGQARNDFPFRNTARIGAPMERQVNNFGEKLDFQQFNHLKINEKNTLETAVWHQRVFRETPPAMTEAAAETWQCDRATRAVATWTNQRSARTQWQHRAAWLDEYIAFRSISDTDTSRSRTALLASEFVTVPTRRIALRASGTAWYQQARADGYADSTAWFSQIRLAGTFAAEYRRRQIHLTAQLRQEWAERQGAPFTSVLGAQWAASSALTVRLHWSRNFNLPTFNDRFWRTLGNPDIRPESGHSADAGVIWKRGGFALETSIFHLLLDDWILWQPGPDGLFQPGNLRRVWSRGVECSGQGDGYFWRSRWRLKGRYQFVRATNAAVYGGNAGVLHKLLPYTPEHSAGASLVWAHGAWSAAYLHQWTGARFGNADNSQRLPGFHTGNLLLRYAAVFGRHRIGLSIRLENCWDTPYQVIAFRPMPGRAWRVGIEWGRRQVVAKK
ncbi:MAG: TonB-dependent receptor [Lewinellaceae bacterium]|nr:TonB-dependent receptor [Lewinellaceae bacterium]